MSVIDPRTPVLVGAGQVLQRVPAGSDGTDPALSEPLDLMEQAARLAAEDAGCPALLSALDSVRVPRGLWPYANPAYNLAERLGSAGAHTMAAPISGNMVQRMLTHGAREIVAGARDVVMVVGAEAEQTKRRLKRAGRKPQWSEPEAPPADLDLTQEDRWMLKEEFEAGLGHPASIFALYENARRHACQEGLDANRDRIARLWHGFAKVAEDNPFAWTQEAPSVESIRDESPDNKMNSYPYTKRLCANISVDLGAAVILCSAERATRLGIPRDRWVFFHTATDCMATPAMSHRDDFLRVPTLDLAAQKALELSRVDAADIAHVDLYSCFPSSVQIAAEALGFPIDRPLTVTGGLAFAGGPFNSYVIHSLATMMDRLRRNSGSLGLVSSVGGAFSKHAFGIYSTAPPERGFQYADLDPEAGALPQRTLATGHEGETRVETYALRHTDGAPSKATLSCLLEDGRRVWASSVDPEVFRDMLARETCGRRALIKNGQLVSF